LNTWFGDILDPILSSHGYKRREYFTDIKCSIFGSSRPDLAFSKHGQGDLVEGVDLVEAVVELPDRSESMEVEEQYPEVDLVQSTIEYKRRSVAKHTCQCYADMIRVANDSVIHC